LRPNSRRWSPRFAARHAVDVKEWAISQTTLEDVFLLIIREVNPARGVKASKSSAATTVTAAPRTSDLPSTAEGPSELPS